ncbi:MAG: 3-hydroxyacyl-CoA dehydrogenase NAD-binding domain-containing protein [Gemmatimonadaceae bacterium]
MSDSDNTTRQSERASPRPTTVAVVGCGVIGRSWVRVFTRAGCRVRLWDSSPASIERALAWHADESVRDTRANSNEEGLEEGFADAATSLPHALSDAQWVQESGPESLGAKQSLFASLDELAPPNAVVASSTSTLDMTEIARDLIGAHRCIVAHPVNPPHVVPAVEVLGGARTSADTVARAVDGLRSVGQVPVVLNRYVPGFLLNRMQMALVREAISLVERGVADVDAIDAVIRDGLGLRWALMGPFGVANTNADGGTREYLTRYSDSLRWLMNDLGETPAMDAALIERLGEQTDRMVDDMPRDRLRAWRDRMVQGITALKRADGGP